VEQISTCHHGGPRAGASGSLKEAVIPWETRTGSSSFQDLWIHGDRSPCWSRFAGRTGDPVGDPCWSSLLLKDCTMWKGPMLEQFMKNYHLWEELTLEKFLENCLPWVRPHTEAVKESKEEGVAESMCD